jgi:hypothetical protein
VGVDVGDPSDIPQVVSTVIRDDLFQLFTVQSNLCHKQNVEKWKTSLKFLKYPDINHHKNKKMFRNGTSDGPSPKRQCERLLVYRSYSNYTNIVTNNEQKLI